MISIDDYIEIKDCIYKNEHYSVRDNGAIMRHLCEGKKKRKLDGIWSFGLVNKDNGYLYWGGERVHRIVATAFHGNSPGVEFVVDHIDTNRQNNRPENLRWLTRLDNVLKNEITRKRIIYRCGSIEAFLKNPSLLSGYEKDDKNFIWMKTVTPEEAKNCLDNMKNWAENIDIKQESSKAKSVVGPWIFESPFVHNARNNTNHISLAKDKVSLEYDYNIDDVTDTIITHKVDTNEWLEKTFGRENADVKFDEYDLSNESLSPFARQSWQTPSEFPLCPLEANNGGLDFYRDKLKEGALLCSNRDFKLYVIDRALIPEKEELIVLCTNKEESSWGTYSLISVKWLKENYIHMIIGRYGDQDSAWKNFFDRTYRSHAHFTNTL